MENEPSIAEAPGPRGAALRETLRELRVDALRAFVSLAEHYGPIASIPAAGNGSVLSVISEPLQVRNVLADQRGNYSKETGTYARLREVIGRGILTAEGEDWRFQRRLVTPCLHAARNHTLLDATWELTAELGERWRSAAERGERVELRRDMAWLTLSILARAVFDCDARETAEAVGTALECVMGEASLRGLRSGTKPAQGAPQGPSRRGRWRAAVTRLDAEVSRISAEPAAAGARPWNLVAALRAARTGRCPFSHAPAADGELDRSVLLTMYLAGHETTATTLAWASSLLAAHPEAAGRVRAEAERELSGSGSLRDKVERLHFTRAVVHEALRLYPPVWLVERRAEREHRLGGYRVPPGTTLALCLYVAQRDPRLWPAPGAFVPERFFAEGARRRLLAFGSGPRGCAGAAFALDEMTLALAALHRSFRLEIGEAAVPHGGITLRTRDPLVARLRAA